MDWQVVAHTPVVPLAMDYALSPAEQNGKFGLPVEPVPEVYCNH